MAVTALKPTMNVCSLAITIPLREEFLREVLETAMRDPFGVKSWGKITLRDGDVFWLDEKEWEYSAKEGGYSKPPQHRVDLYVVSRGLLKVFDIGRPIEDAIRAVVLEALYGQDRGGTVLHKYPTICSLIVQLALFDQQVYS